MGNGTSQSVILGPSRSLGHSMHPARFERAPAKYAHPNNRVLPKPIAGQRLRSTDNGHILHSAGTIRGLKSTSPVPQDQEEGDPEVLGILKRRSEMIERDQQKCNGSNLPSHRMFYSDTDISQCRPINGRSPDVQESTSSRRPCGGAAARTNKIKQRKKARAPEPPPTDFPGHFQRRAQSTTDLTRERNCDCRCSGIPEWKPKSRAPQPPHFGAQSVPPDPPPPPPSHEMAAKVSVNPHGSSRSTPFSDVTKPCTNRPSSVNNQFAPRDSSRTSRLSYSVDDLRCESRNTVFDSKCDLSRSKPKSNLPPQQPDPFQREIEAVTKRIAQSRQINSEDDDNQTKKTFTPKQYYFSDKDVFRTDAPKTSAANGKKKVEQQQITINGYHRENNNERGDERKSTGEELMKNGESPLQRFSPNRRRLKSPVRTVQDDNCNNERISMKPFHNDDDSDIDLRLRPVLPRKAPNIKVFSPTEAWQALGPEDQGHGTRSTSEESGSGFREVNNKYSKNKDNGAFCRNFVNNANSSNSCSFSESQWTPRQDLDDSDSSSVNSDDVVLPKSQLGEFSTRFSLPTVMFSNMRPIGIDIPSAKRSIPSYNEFGLGEASRYEQAKKKSTRQPFANSDLNSASHFKKFLGMKNKYLSEEDVSVSDSNWTFGGHGLQQKRGKQYASDLMLSDKKKYELVVKNHFGEFLGDILVTKANDMRNKMRPVDSRNSNFSFYSTEGHVMYLPKSSDCDDHESTIRSKFNKTDQADYPTKAGKRPSDFDNSSSLDLVRMLEDDVRRRRSKEKLCIRKQLQMIKRLDTEDEETEEEVDEAYFTEPKSLEGSSPLHVPSTKFTYFPGARTVFNNNYSASSPLKHWTSSPALLDERVGKPFPPAHPFFSSSSATSSPDPTVWPKKQDSSEKWFQRKQHPQNRRQLEKQRRVSDGDSSPPFSNRHDGMEKGPAPNNKDQRKGAAGHSKTKKPSIYKQLMDIVRREEKQMKKAQGNSYDPPVSRDSSYSQRESSHSSSSHDSMSSSYSDSSSSPPDCSGKSGVPANDEFHTSTSMGMQRNQDASQGKTPPFQVAFVQPFSPSRGYRPVPFDLAVPAAANCRMPTLQEGHKFQAEVS